MADFKKLGFIVNPIAGMGGSVGLKGSDGQEILEKARDLGAEPQAPRRAKEFLHELRGLKAKIKIITIAGVMGGREAKEQGFEVDILKDSGLPEESELYQTKPEHTKKAAKLMLEKEVS